MKHTLLLLFLTISQLVVSAQYCNTGNRFTDQNVFNSTQLDSLLNITYGYALDHQGNRDTLRLDVHFPNTSIDTLSQMPVIVMVHGGAFIVGSKEQRRDECIALAKKGYIVFNLAYRLGWNVFFPSQQVLAMYRAHQDVHAALRFIVNNSLNLPIDTNWMFGAGYSAGAVTLNNIAYTDQTEWNTIYPGIQNQLGRLDTSGNSLNTTFHLSGIFNNWGGVPKDAMQPAEMIPQIAFHGDQDSTVLIDSSSNLVMGSRAIHNRLTSQSVCASLTVDTLGGHGILTSRPGTNMRLSNASCFFKSLFCNSCFSQTTNDSIPIICSVLSGITETTSSTYSIYPNPIQDEFQIKGLQGNERFSLYQLEGKLIYDKISIQQLNFGALKSGTYLLIIHSLNKRQYLKLMKQ